MKITMKWRANNKNHKPKPHIRAPKIQWQQLGLTDPAQEAASIDEIRRQVVLASSRGLGHGVRAQTNEQTGPGKGTPPRSEPRRSRRRGATE